MKLLRSFIFAVWLYASMAFVGLVLWPFVLMDDRHVYTALRWWSHATLWGLRWIIGARVSFEGLENVPEGGALVAMKHQSMLDTIVPSLFLKKPTYVYKAELGATPVMGAYLKKNQIAVDRGGHAKALKSVVRGAREAVAKGRQVLIFPEGTRQPLGAAPDYKPGIAAMYKDLGVPVTPVALNTGLIWKPKGLMRSPGHVTFKVLPPIPAGLPRDEFMRELERVIESESEALLPPEKRRSVAA
ncbi:MAG TPA: lysophospholipid acyltransferase family protein [Vitreimonas sp.]|uniref:lysophospholipid acyltransferase family protein n=1 Tax=Vitreimonas sp. TaxID=3069702 RepID=UPI002D76326C|nr:lysophospholipid acyltransferase family protein [Vitreimonas sp.]HYD89413.1 lysophospholipid acyltransferase family protein [Vitreimonas sp.]